MHSGNKRLGLFHVSDYANTCLRNAYYSHLSGAKHGHMDTNLLSVLFSGEAIHRMLDVKDNGMNLGETKCMWNFVKDEAVDLDNLPTKVEDWMEILVGEFDALYDLSELTIVDYKTWLSKGYVKKSVDSGYKAQVEMYAYLLNRCKGLTVKRGAIVYYDFGNRGSKPTIFDFRIPAIKTIENKIKAKYEQFKIASETRFLPDRTIDWKCHGYCPYSERCFSEEKMKKGEKLVAVNL